MNIEEYEIKTDAWSNPQSAADLIEADEFDAAIDMANDLAEDDRQKLIPFRNKNIERLGLNGQA